MFKQVYKADKILKISKRTANKFFMFHTFQSCLKIKGSKPCCHLKFNPFVSQLRFNQSKNIDYYKVLGVKPNATAKQIKKMFYDKSKKLHPDSLKTGSKDTTNEFIKVKQAYEILSNTKSRHEYDSYRRSSLKQTHSYDEWKNQGGNKDSHRSTYSNINTSGVHGMKFEQQKEQHSYKGVKSASFWFDVSVIAVAFGVLWIIWKREMEMSALGFGTFYNELWKGYRSGPRETYDQMLQQSYWSQKNKNESVHHMDKNVTSETFAINPHKNKQKKKKKSKKKSAKKKKISVLSSEEPKTLIIDNTVNKTSVVSNLNANSEPDKINVNDHSDEKFTPLFIKDQTTMSETNTSDFDNLYIDIIDPVGVCYDQTFNRDELIPLSDINTTNSKSSNLNEPSRGFSTEISISNKNHTNLNIVNLSEDVSDKNNFMKNATIESVNSNILEPIYYKDFTINIDDLKTW